VNHYHERQLVHLVAAHDRAVRAGEMKEVEQIKKRMLEKYGYLITPGDRLGEPRLVK